MNDYIRYIKNLVFIFLIFTCIQGWSQTDVDTNSTEKSAIPPKIHFGTDYFPSSLMTEPVASGAESLKLQVSNFNFGVAVPDRINDRNVITHGLEYSQLNINYFDLNVDLGAMVRVVHSIEYNFTWEKTLSKKWDLMTIVKPGLASEFKSDLSRDDFILTVASIGIRKYSKRLAIGYGVGFNPNFGSHYPLPIIAMRWNNGKNIKIETILPINFSFAYRPNSVFDLGLDFEVEGSRYHGNPNAYGVDNPQLRYSVTKGGSVHNF